MYEQRPLSYQRGASIVLASNGLRVLSSIDPELVANLRPLGFTLDTGFYFNEAGEKTGDWPLGSKDFGGIQGLRIFRHLIVEELSNLCKQRGIPILYKKQFSQIVSRSPGSLVFSFADGSKSSASILVGADGLHSAVRQQVFPSVRPEYVTSAVLFSFSKSSIRNPWPMPCSITTKYGAFICIPQDPAGEDILAARQIPIPEPRGNPREAWRPVRDDKIRLVGLLRSNMEDMPYMYKSALENMRHDDVQLWPYYNIPELDKWVSGGTKAEEQTDCGKVVILGDAAHATPPSSAQGGNQAFEDSYSLAFMLSHISKSIPITKALGFWEGWRKERIAKIGQFALHVNNKRSPMDEQNITKTEETGKDTPDRYGDAFFRWLFRPQLDEEMLRWVREQDL